MLDTLPFDDLPPAQPELANAAPIPEREDGATCGTCVECRMGGGACAEARKGEIECHSR